MATIQSTISHLVAHFSTSSELIDQGIALAEEKIAALINSVDDDRVVFSSIEGNQFRWSESGLSEADRLSMWSGLLKQLEAIKIGGKESPSFFTPSFSRISI